MREETEQERQAREQADFAQSELNEEEIRISKGEPPLDPFYGIDKNSDDEYTEDHQDSVPTTNEKYERPRALAEAGEDVESFVRYAERFLPPDYAGPHHADHVQSVREGVDLAKYEMRQEQLSERLMALEANAQKKYRDYDPIVNDNLVPLIEKNGGKHGQLFQMLLHMPDPPEAAYLFARMIANGGKLPSNTRRRLNSLSQAEIDRMSVSEMENFLARVREGVEEDEVDNSEAINREKMRRHSKMSLSSFANELDRYKLYGD